MTDELVEIVAPDKNSKKAERSLTFLAKYLSY